MKARGDKEGRDERGALLPRGPVTPQATFSPCFGGPFLVWHPARYADLLAAKRNSGSAPNSAVNAVAADDPIEGCQFRSTVTVISNRYRHLFGILGKVG